MAEIFTGIVHIVLWFYGFTDIYTVRARNHQFNGVFEAIHTMIVTLHTLLSCEPTWAVHLIFVHVIY